MANAREGGVWRRSRLATAVAAVAAAVALAFAPAPADAAGDVVEVAQDPADVRDYWTPKRMREAIPAGPLAEVDGAAKQRGTIAEPVSRPGKKPKRSHGKVFFTLGAFDFVCSGTAVRAPAENVVWTAGHCVYDKPSALEQPRFVRNWAFVPGYRDGRRKLGTWAATDLATTSQWRNCGLTSCENFAHDFGAANVTGPGGKTLQQRTRGRRIEFNGPRDRTYRAYGYPAGAPFDGQRLYKCRSPWLGNDPSAGNPPPMQIRCDMTGGSSGGGWVVGGAVASVISYGYGDDPNSLYGPYQGTAAQSLYNQVKNG